MEANTNSTPAPAPRRRRSENVGWGSIPKLINAERAARDTAQRAKVRAQAPRSR